MPAYTAEPLDGQHELVRKLVLLLQANGGTQGPQPLDNLNWLWRRAYRNYADLAGQSIVGSYDSNYNFLRKATLLAQSVAGGGDPASTSDSFVGLLRKLVRAHAGNYTLYDSETDLLRRLLSLEVPDGTNALGGVGGEIIGGVGEVADPVLPPPLGGVGSQGVGGVGGENIGGVGS